MEEEGVWSQVMEEGEVPHSAEPEEEEMEMIKFRPRWLEEKLERDYWNCWHDTLVNEVLELVYCS